MNNLLISLILSTLVLSNLSTAVAADLNMAGLNNKCVDLSILSKLTKIVRESAETVKRSAYALVGMENESVTVKLPLNIGYGCDRPNNGTSDSSSTNKVMEKWED